MTDSSFRRTWAEIDLSQIARNIGALRRLADRAEVMAVVKADAYGHGAVPVAHACAEAGVAHFGVACLTEALELRQAGITQDIYTLSPFLPEDAADLVQADIIPMVSSPEQWDALAGAAARTRDAAIPARCFLKVDTGLGRSGCLPDEARTLWMDAARTPCLKIAGIVTHFASAGEPDPAPTVAQTHLFAEFLRSLPTPDAAEEDGLYLSWANSPATLRRFPLPGPLPPLARRVLVRTGALLFGIEPFAGALAGTGLGPALAWKARITLLRDLPAGATVGYGRTHTLARPSRVATLAVGYADGLPRRLSNRGQALLRGRRCPIIGRVSMDQCQIDVTDAPDVTLGDTATIIGTDGAETQTVFDIAEQINTTSHEPTCALTRRVPRVYRSS